ncbi:MAG: hypothetical protein EON59_14570 [Alphaproteobacteria bacterium]|nr:MAG: hypothetical protein EON59_14570 [Alphaproteobacteria bacterium]
MISALATVAVAVAAAAPPSECELHIWPTRKYNAIVHGASPGAGGMALTITTKRGGIDALGQALPPDVQNAIFKTQVSSAASPFRGFMVITHDAPEASRFWDFTDKHVGDGPRETASKSPCYAELHLVALSVYKTTLHQELQTIYGSSAVERWQHALSVMPPRRPP